MFLDQIGVYIPCNTPLIHRTEHELLGPFKAEVLSEHILALLVAHRVAGVLDEHADLVGHISRETLDDLGDDLGSAIGRDLPDERSFFKQVLVFARNEILETQRAINKADSGAFYGQALSFSTLLMPFFETLRRIDALSQSHFLLMIDDAHDLNKHQIQVLNTWIAYRDHSLFSFKVATVKVDRPPSISTTGGSILEGHDFTVVDMEKPIHNTRSDFGRLANRIVKRRLERIGCDKTPDQFFPLHETVASGLEEARQEARFDAVRKFPDGTDTQINDYVYKYHRAIYFRRANKANLPVYSGFKTITYLSTGVVRNLLEPCFSMYDKAMSIDTENGGEAAPDVISPTIQNEIIMQQSEKAWALLRDGLDRVVVGCSDDDATRLKRLFEQIAQLFRARLSTSCSEPRATVVFHIRAGTRTGHR